MSVSIIVTTYNDAEYLDRCLTSLFDQTVRPSDIIVVNDGSTEGLKHLDAAKRKFEARFIDQDNMGPSSARNRGLAEVTAEHVTFVDADDWLVPDNLEKRLRSLENGAVAAYGGFIAIDEDGSTSRSRFSQWNGPLDPDRIGISIPGGLHQHLFKTDAVRKAGGLDPSLRMMEDFDLVLRIRGDFTGNNDPIYYRTIRRNSLSRHSAHTRFKETMLFLAKARRERYFSRRELARRHVVSVLSYAQSLAGIRDCH
jgi:glycosyltransferase involved in cell wall biosynthesis